MRRQETAFGISWILLHSGVTPTGVKLLSKARPACELLAGLWLKIQPMVRTSSAPGLLGRIRAAYWPLYQPRGINPSSSRALMHCFDSWLPFSSMHVCISGLSKSCLPHRRLASGVQAVRTRGEDGSAVAGNAAIASAAEPSRAPKSRRRQAGKIMVMSPQEIVRQRRRHER